MRHSKSNSAGLGFDTNSFAVPARPHVGRVGAIAQGKTRLISDIRQRVRYLHDADSAEPPAPEFTVRHCKALKGNALPEG